MSIIVVSQKEWKAARRANRKLCSLEYLVFVK
jgi:hypothetical protein